MKRDAFARRLLALCLLLALVLAGCGEQEGERCGYAMSDGAGFAPTGVVVGMDMSVASFSDFAWSPTVRLLHQVLPEDFPLYIAAYTEAGEYQVWEREALDESGFSLGGAGMDRAGPEALGGEILSHLSELDVGERPLIAMFTGQDVSWDALAADAADEGAMFYGFSLPTSYTRELVASYTVSTLRTLSDALDLQVVALPGGEGQETAFTLPDLGVQRMSFLVQGSLDTLVYEGNDITTSQDFHGFRFQDDSFLYAIGYQTKPGAGDYTLRCSQEGAAVWLCFQHTLDVDWQLYAESGEHIVAGEPMYLELRLTRDGQECKLPNGLSAECEWTMDGVTSALPLDVQSDHFYQRNGRKLVSDLFSVPEGSRYAAALTLQYPDFGTLSFLCNRGNSLTMENFAPYLREDALTWTKETTQVFTPEQLFRDPEGDRVTLKAAEGDGGIQASIDEDGRLVLKADNRLFVRGTVTLTVTNEQQEVYQDTVQARYMRLSWPVLLLVMYLIVSLFAAIYFIHDFWHWTMSRPPTTLDKLYNFFAGLLFGIIWPIFLGMWLYEDVPYRLKELWEKKHRSAKTSTAKSTPQTSAAKQTQKDKEKSSKQSGAAAQPQKAQTNAQKDKERREQALKELEKEIEAQERARKQEAELRRLQQQIHSKQAELLEAREQFTRTAKRLREDLAIHRWLVSSSRPSGVGHYLQAHPELNEKLLAYPSDQAGQAVAKLESSVKKIDEALPFQSSGPDMKAALESALEKIGALQRELLDTGSLKNYKSLRLDDAVRTLYDKFHSAPAGAVPPVLVKILTPGRAELRYLGCDQPTDSGVCNLGRIVMSGRPNEPGKRLEELIETAGGVSLILSAQDGRPGYEVAGGNATFFDPHDTGRATCPFLEQGREYQLRGTSVFVAVKPSIE